MRRTRIYNNGILISWNQRRCEKCQRFLSRRQLKYCFECYRKEWLQQQKLWYKNHREQKIESANVWRANHPEKWKEYAFKKKYGERALIEC